MITLKQCANWIGNGACFCAYLIGMRLKNFANGCFAAIENSQFVQKNLKQWVGYGILFS